MSIYKNKNLLALKGKLFKFPTVLINYIADVFGYGWDRNRAIDTLGTQNNALMGGYLLAASNTVIAITGILTTDTIVPLTSGGNVGSVAVNGTISFSLGLKYGAFEVYRGIARIGRYCLTERQGLRIINQVTGGLPNGLLGGTTTTVWQRSNAFYCETNHTGYSISATGWVTSEGVGLTSGTIVPADPINPTKCMAWVSSVQQDLQFIGKARNSVSVMPYAFNMTQVTCPITYPLVTITDHYMSVYIYIISAIGASNGATIAGQAGYGNGDHRNGGIMLLGYSIWLSYNGTNGGNILSLTAPLLVPLLIEGGFTGGVAYLRYTILTTGQVVSATYEGTVTSNTRISAGSGIRANQAHILEIKEYINGALAYHLVPDQHAYRFIDLKNKVGRVLSGTTALVNVNTDIPLNIYNSVGYELWYNGTDYQIYPIASDGTTIITPAGYTSEGKVTAGNMPSVADSRFTTFKYALANSYAVRQSVPEAFDATDPCTPKLLTYSELSALSANPKVTKTEVNGKITNLTIRQ